MSFESPVPARLGARAALALAGAVAALGLAACGDEDETTTVGADGATTTIGSSEDGDDGGTVTIEAEKGAFDAQAIYSKVSPGVVTILSIFEGDDALGGILGADGGQPLAGQGSGFVISDEGEIVTNAHVVTDAQSAGAPDRELNAADEVYVRFDDGNQVPAEVVGFDPFADVALLKISPDGLDLVPLSFADSDGAEVGQAVAAIGSPFSNEGSLTTGIISANNRSVESLTSFQIDGAIQTDASINPGNSGGPLLNAEGEVLGINQQINTASGGNEGIGFAVPSNLVQRSVEDLRPDGEVSYAYLGVTTQPLYPQLAEELGFEDVSVGALISEVVSGSPADAAGLEGGDREITFQGQPQICAGGDAIVSVDGTEIVVQSDLPKLISQKRPGDVVTLGVIHDGGEREDIEVTLEDRSSAGTIAPRTPC